jgi:hypothetical protein
MAFFYALSFSHVTFVEQHAYSNKQDFMKHLLRLLFFLPLFIQAQVNEGLTAEERAYLFHVVRKSPILETNIGRYFDYKGPDIRFANKDINYDSVELIIMNQPDLLIIRREEIAKSPKGILSEVANKMAIWELNCLLQAKRGSDDELKPFQEKYARFEEMLVANLPPTALKEEDGAAFPHPKLINVLNPSLSLDDKTAMIATFRFLNVNDQLVTMEAIHTCINAYVQDRSLEIFRLLGGVADHFQNVLVAAGDGSSTTGLLEEREKDEKGRWNKGLPKAVGLFPYQLQLTPVAPIKDQEIISLLATTTDLKTIGNGRETNVHLDVWGYNSKKQTTVVIERNGISYHLFGAGDTRFLSPDSTFSEGATFQSIINDLEFNRIAKLHEMIFGKRGFDYWIDYNKKKKDEVELKIEINEKNFSDLTLRPITTKNKPSRAKRKEQKRQQKNHTKDDKIPDTTVDGGKKQKGKSQNDIVYLYNMFEAYKKKIAELELQRTDALALMEKYQSRLSAFKQLMGLNWATYTENEGLYTFSDSSTFDMYTQEFIFPSKQQEEDFEVRLIAIPETCLSEQADEVMLHINVTDAEPLYDARLQIELLNQFGSDKWDLHRSLFSQEDSVALMQFFEGLLDKNRPFSIIARGQGVGEWNGLRVIKANQPLVEQEKTAKYSHDDPEMLRLRRSEVYVFLEREIQLEVNSYTDPRNSNIEALSPEIQKVMSTYGLSKNDVLSAYRTANIMRKMKEEINVLAGTYLDREKARIVIDRFNKEWSRVRISVGPTSFKLSEIPL